ncbi:MAG: hypothetical protein AAF226_18980, partial [Verrucomicrobiota bacterium]
KMRVTQKRREMLEIEKTQRSVKGWLKHYDSYVEVEARKADKLHQILDNDMQNAVRFLNEAVKNLQEYNDNFSGS